MAEQAENNQVDETENFIVTSSNDDLYGVTEETEEAKPEELASSEDEVTEETESTEVTEDNEPTGEESEEGESEQQTSEEDTTANTGKKPKGVQKRINKLVREKEESKRENERLKREIEELRKGGKESEPEVKELIEPKESDFETYSDYLNALDEYDSKSQEKVKETEEKPKPEDLKKDNSESTGITDAQKTALAVIQESVSNAEKPKDFEAVALDPSVPVTGDMLEAIAECDDPVKVMYYLGNNKDVASDIAGSSRAKQMIQIAKIDEKAESWKPPKPKTTTKAPDPIEPVRGQDAQKKHESDMTFSEYEKEMNKREKERLNW